MRAYLLLPALALTAACSSEPTISATNVSVEEVQNQITAAGNTNMQMRPGRWEGTLTIKNVSPIGGGETGQSEAKPLKVCVTPDQIKPGTNPLASEMQQGCRYDTFKMAGGKIDATMTCARPGVTLKNKISGEFTGDTYKLTSVAEASGPGAGPMEGIRAESTIDARRTGECKGDETRS